MPKKFTQCAKSGGRVRTLTKGSQRGRKICFKGGKATLGHKKRK